MNLIVTDRANLLSDYAPIQPRLTHHPLNLGLTERSALSTGSSS
ncbi:MAG: hypothetical protein SAL07_03315 [Oscillatoria sp. PMC 1051.18]|nr:hypothetical protein [Oscillatoria sp. PMC 1051.18]